jgi:hypothetical protein
MCIICVPTIYVSLLYTAEVHSLYATGNRNGKSFYILEVQLAEDVEN